MEWHEKAWHESPSSERFFEFISGALLVMLRRFLFISMVYMSAKIGLYILFAGAASHNELKPTSNTQILAIAHDFRFYIHSCQIHKFSVVTCLSPGRSCFIWHDPFSLAVEPWKALWLKCKYSKKKDCHHLITTFAKRHLTLHIQTDTK